MLAVCSLWEGQLLWRGELDDDGYIWLPLYLEDECRGSLITEEGAKPVLEGRIVNLPVGLDNVRGFQDHDELCVVGWLVRWTSFAHGV